MQESLALDSPLMYLNVLTALAVGPTEIRSPSLVGHLGS